MKITSNLFEAYLKCPTKCFLLSRGETGAGNEYADWVQVQSKLYRDDRIKELINIGARDGRIITSALTKDPKLTDQEYVLDFVADTPELESHIYFIERTLPKELDKPVQFVPTRFICTNKINKHDKLLLGFDALALSEVLGHEVGFGKIIHGDDRSTLNLKTPALATEVRKLISKITTLISHDSPPDLILNRYCAECEFQLQCRQKAVETNDLSLLSGLTATERSYHRSKGIFTVNQLSYTFRPRKISKRAKHPAKPHYFALQTLAIRENIVYIHGSPRLPESKTKIYLDIEGLPDEDFYYLVGVLAVTDGREFFHSFWADTKTEELTIFTQFAEVLSELTDFCVFHYGDYESTALKRIKTRLPNHIQPVIDTILSNSINVLSLVYPHIYFPAYSNSLKQIGSFLGFKRQAPIATGLESVMWRKIWEKDRSEPTKTALFVYNKDDCFELKHLCEFISGLNLPALPNDQIADIFPKTINTDDLRKDKPRWQMFGRKEYALESFEDVCKAAYFDYQREKVYLRTDLQLKTINKQHRKLKRTELRPNQKLVLEARKCVHCRSRKIEHKKRCNCVLIDLRFSASGVKKWITKTIFSRYYCFKCARQLVLGRVIAAPT